MGGAFVTPIQASIYGEKFFKLGNYYESVWWYNNSIESIMSAHPKVENAKLLALLLTNRSIVLMAQGFVDSALCDALFASLLMPSLSRPSYLLFLCQKALGFGNEAQINLSRAMSINPFDPNIVVEFNKFCEKRTETLTINEVNICSSCPLLCWGKGSFGALGHGDTKDQVIEFIF